jgi:hypothetical protein
MRVVVVISAKFSVRVPVALVVWPSGLILVRKGRLVNHYLAPAGRGCWRIRTSGLRRFGGRRPVRQATQFSAAMLDILSRVSIEALPM